MKTINFMQFALFMDIAKTREQVSDVREAFANILYSQVSGIRAHDLAFKIYRSNGAVEIDGEDSALLRSVAARYCTPAFIDALEGQLKDKEE
ncbi:MAG: hypothetical protein LBN29_01380 [Mediterranea sp.]|jgi:hypothetical protein|nr:hypothetical protein [Mediterranea sp.]